MVGSCHRSRWATIWPIQDTPDGRTSIATPLLETKLYVPRPRRGLVARPRLRERLARGIETKLTLISAPPGFGKTTLLAEWLAGERADERATAWLSLDPGDSVATTFWAYLVAALQTVAPGIGERALGLLQGPQPPPIETILATLLNELGGLPGDVVLVLDDYHVIDAPEIHEAMAFLLDHLPPRLHLVITTRADPALPLARLRARGELVEIRAADLRFTPDEAAAYLNEVMDLHLAAREVDALEGRTEGWIAALQLAALSIRGRDDVAGFIAGFTGDDRYIVDYLVEEVLHRQSGDVRDFLLQTSILDRLSGPLCDAVTGQDGGRATLEALERGNLFLVPLDDRRRWYRYHHLFGDVLRARLLDERPGEVPELHRRAAEWHERNGDRAQAIRHALAGGDVARAADLIELAIPETRPNREETTLRGWCAALPPAVFGDRPVLAVGFAGALMSTGTFEGVEPLLESAERWLPMVGSPEREAEARAAGMVVADVTEFRRLPETIAMYHAAYALAHGDVAGAITHATRARDRLDADDHFRRGAFAALLGLAYWASADLDAAYRWYAEGMAHLDRADLPSDVVGGAITLADIRLAQGRLGDALRICERGLALATGSGGPALRGAADMHVGIADILYRRDDLAGASQHLSAARQLGEANGLPKFPARSRMAMARVREAEGDLDGALDLLVEAEPRYVPDFAPNVRPIAALKTRIWIAQGRLSDAWAWARERGVSPADEPDYLHEFEHLVLARLLLAQGRHDGTREPIRTAVDLLERLLAAAEAGERQGSVLEILIVGALARDALGDETGAIAALERAARLAEPEGEVRAFLDEGPPMAAMLSLAARQRDAHPSVRRLLGVTSAAPRAQPVDQGLVEPLSERELEVLRLLAGDLDGPDIARQLFVSLNTLRTHTRNVYAKLGVSSRRAAVSRAEELGLLSRG